MMPRGPKGEKRPADAIGKRRHDRQDCHRLADIKTRGVNRRAMVLSSR